MSQSQSYGAGQRLSLPVHNDLEDLLLWRDPSKTGAVFGGFTVLYLLLEWSNYSLLTLVANVLLVGVSITFLWNNLAQFLNKPGVPVPAVLQQGISDNQSKAYAQQFTSGVNQLLGFARRIITGKEVILSVQAALVLYAIAKIGNFFSTLGLVYTVIVLVFTLPKVYELRKHEIDNAANQVAYKTKQGYSQYAAPYLNKIPKASSATTSGYNRRGDDSSTADSASVAPNGAQEFKKTY